MTTCSTSENAVLAVKGWTIELQSDNCFLTANCLDCVWIMSVLQLHDFCGHHLKFIHFDRHKRHKHHKRHKRSGSLDLWCHVTIVTIATKYCHNRHKRHKHHKPFLQDHTHLKLVVTFVTFVTIVTVLCDDCDDCDTSEYQP